MKEPNNLVGTQTSSHFATRDFAAHKDACDPRAVRAIEEAISKARYIVEVITCKLK
jgi:hypothetical protein